MTSLIPTLNTERLILRAPVLEDLPSLVAFFQTERAERVGGRQDERAVHRGMMSCFGIWALYGFGRWHIADRETNRFLGWAGLMFGPAWEEPELGWTVMPEAEGRGIAYEAALAARGYAAQNLGLATPISYIDPDNHRSQALARKLGATVERRYNLLGHPVDVWRHPASEAAA